MSTNPADSDSNQFGVMLVNLGTPAAPTPAAVRKYLKEFLWDKRVVDTPPVIWWFVLNCIILRFRPRRVAKLYRAIWTEDGSPLMVNSQSQAKALQLQLNELGFTHANTKLAMTYGEPSIACTIQAFQQDGIERILVLPLYPQYSGTTTGAVTDAVFRSLSQLSDIPEIRFIKAYYQQDVYLEALAQSVTDYWNKNGKAERLLISFHGIPQKYADRGDPYPAQCKETARALASRLKLRESQWLCSFQSRFGPAEWVQPYTDKILQEWGEGGLNRVDVICPAFTSDCLETLEEIKVENARIFKKAGGGEYHYIPALNERPEFINCLFDLVVQHSQGW